MVLITASTATGGTPAPQPARGAMEMGNGTHMYRESHGNPVAGHGRRCSCGSSLRSHLPTKSHQRPELQDVIQPLVSSRMWLQPHPAENASSPPTSRVKPRMLLINSPLTALSPSICKALWLCSSFLLSTPDWTENPAGSSPLAPLMPLWNWCHIRSPLLSSAADSWWDPGIGSTSVSHSTQAAPSTQV